MRYLYGFLIILVVSCSKNIEPPTQKPPVTTVKDTVIKITDTVVVFKGYPVNPNARILGTDYWFRGTGILNDLIVQTFQTPLPTNSFGMQHNFIQGGWTMSTCGDFNNDGWVDVFTPGSSNFISSTFLIWDTLQKTFKEKNLFNDKSIVTISGAIVKTIPIYLNEDNYLDVILIGTGEDRPTVPNVKIKLMISDGQGGYDIKEIETNETDVFENNATPNKFGGDVGDLNGDNINDLVLTCGPYVYIYWGIKNFPYFKKEGNALFSPWYKDIGAKNNNGFGEKCVGCGSASNAVIMDLNDDNKNDIILASNENELINNYTTNNTNVITTHRVLINLGSGRFNENSVKTLPFYSTTTVENFDYIVDDVNGDGMKDIITTNHEIFDYSNPNIFPKSDFFIYIKKQDGSYVVDKSWFNFSNDYNTKKINKWGKPRLIYYDYNNDGKKDITYIDSNEGNEFGSNNLMSKKTVFIRKGNQFVEEDIYQYDSYYKKILDILNKRFK
jgi:hypothetical protein